jgi:hypothetical protein
MWMFAHGFTVIQFAWQLLLVNGVKLNNIKSHLLPIILRHLTYELPNVQGIET